jgi:hypothetical protein
MAEITGSRSDGLAHDLKAVLGAKIYVEHRKLVEVLPDGTSTSADRA